MILTSETVENDFVTLVERFASDFHESRSHSWKMANYLVSDKNL